MTPTLRRTVLIMAVSLLAACGGGGGGSSFSGGSPSPAPAEYVALTAGNAEEVARATLEGIDAAATISQLTALALALAGFDPPVPAAAPGGMAAQALLPSAVSEDTLDCLASGTITVTTDLATPGELNVGDSIAAVFADCDGDDGLIIDGSYELQVNSFSGDLDGGLYVLQGTVALDGLLLTVDGESLSLDGNVSADLDVDTASEVVIALGDDLGGASLAYVLNGVSGTIEDFLVEIATNVTNPADPEESMNASGTLVSVAGIGGKVDFATFAPLVQRESLPFPTSGEVEITGADASTVLVSDLSSPVDGVVIDIDSDGDGEYELADSIETTWPVLLP